MPNVELLRKTLAHIEAHPEQWDQTDWTNPCGTAFCFAGWAVKLSGGDFYREPDRGDVIGDLVVPAGETDPLIISGYAADLLDLDDEEDEDGELRVPLFDAHNTLDDLRRIVSELCGGAS